MKAIKAIMRIYNSYKPTNRWTNSKNSIYCKNNHLRSQTIFMNIYSLDLWYKLPKKYSKSRPTKSTGICGSDCIVCSSDWIERIQQPFLERFYRKYLLYMLGSYSKIHKMNSKKWKKSWAKIYLTAYFKLYSYILIMRCYLVTFFSFWWKYRKPKTLFNFSRNTL